MAKMLQVITKLNSGVNTFVKAGTIQDDAKLERSVEVRTPENVQEIKKLLMVDLRKNSLKNST